MAYNNYNNYYCDENGNTHRDIPLGTAPGDAFARTNIKLKEEVRRIDGTIDNTNERINHEISRLENEISDVTVQAQTLSENVSTECFNKLAELETLHNDDTVALDNKIDDTIDNLNALMDSKVSSIENRIDNIIVNGTETEGNTELIDIRTGIDGTIYGSAGAAVRTQVNQLNSSVNSVNRKLDGIGRYESQFYTVNYSQNLECVSQTTFYGLGNVFTVDFPYLGKVRAFTCAETDIYCDILDESFNLIASRKASNKGNGLFFYDFDFNIDVSSFNTILVGIRAETKNLYRYGSSINYSKIPQSPARGIYYNDSGWHGIESLSQTVPMELYSAVFVQKEKPLIQSAGYNLYNYIYSLKTVSGTWGYGSHNITALKDSRLLSVSIYSKGERTIPFVVGKTDQYNLLIPSCSFEIDASKGYDTYDLTEKNIIVKAGEQLFVYVGDNTDPRTNNLAGYEELLQTPIIIQDGTESSVEGYEGLIFSERSDLALLYSYELEDYNDVQDSLDSIKADTEMLKNTSKQPFTLYSPDGHRFRLLLGNNNQINLNKYYPQKMFVMGNSLTDTTFTANDNYYQIGLAASDNTKDWFSLVCNYFKSKNANFTATRRNFASWETTSDSADRRAILENSVSKLINGNEDLIIIQLGDNVSTPSQLSTFAEDYKYLIQWFRENCPNALVVCAGLWYHTEQKETIIKNVCSEMGILYADFTAYSNQQKYKSSIGNIQTIYDENGTIVGTREISNSGSASHPGDLGMEAIANTIINTIYPE